ncbi:MAG: DUF3078 domain-containing protein [Cyclobacteriaceae bacterium]|nr:DUF3078 domain-containing protein [Cyclobacteriaceae bacterium]
MKLNKIAFTALAILGSITLLTAKTIYTTPSSDTTYWEKGAKTTFTFTQTTLENWAAGGENSVAFNSGLRAFASYVKGRTMFDNLLEIGYGIIDQGDVGLRKNDDKIIFSTKIGHKIKEDGKIYWSSLIDFKSQFNKGVDYQNDGSEIKISDFMAPGYLTVSTGLEWKPNNFFSLSYSPVAGKMTFVGIQRFADRGDFGVDPAVYDEVTSIKLVDGKNLRTELGSFNKIQVKKDIVKNVKLETNLELFTAYDETFGNVDINWQNVITMKINGWLMTSFITQLLYDDDIHIATQFDEITGDPLNAKPRIQYKQILGVGLTFSLGDKYIPFTERVKKTLK